MSVDEKIEWLKSFRDELFDRPGGSSRIMKYDGSYLITDVGYALEGIDFVIEELIHVLEVNKI